MLLKRTVALEKRHKELLTLLMLPYKCKLLDFLFWFFSRVCAVDSAAAQINLSSVFFFCRIINKYEVHSFKYSKWIFTKP